MSGLLSRFRKPKVLDEAWATPIGDHVIALATAKKTVVAAAVSGPIHLLSSDSGKEVTRLEGHGQGTLSLGLHPEGTIVASSGQDGTVRLWCLQTGQMLRCLDAGGNWAERTVWNRTGDRLVSIAGKCIRLWDKSGELVREYSRRKSSLSDVLWMPRSNCFATSEYGEVNLWGPDSSEPLRTLKWKGSILRIAVNAGEEYLAAGAQDSSVHTWRLSDGGPMEMTGYPRKVRELAWDATGRWLATGGGPAPCVWDCSGEGPAGTEPIQFMAHTAPVSFLAFAPRGDLLACTGEDGRLFIWKMSSPRKHLWGAAIEGAYTTVIWSDSGSSLYTGSAEGTVRAYAITV